MQKKTYVNKTDILRQNASLKATSVPDSSSQSESLQRKADLANAAAQRAAAPRSNSTGMPDNLKAGIESLSGYSMDDVRVHYNSSKPATVQALAYTQGTDIHVAPGQEKCLPHEAWHVAQQMAGRVSPTTNINGMPVNDNAALEHEADVMGEKAIQCKHNEILEKKNVSLGALQLCCSIVKKEAEGVPSKMGNVIALKNVLKEEKNIEEKNRKIKNVETFDVLCKADLKSYDYIQLYYSFKKFLYKKSNFFITLCEELNLKLNKKNFSCCIILYKRKSN